MQVCEKVSRLDVKRKVGANTAKKFIILEPGLSYHCEILSTKSPTSGKAGGLMIRPHRANKNRELPKRAAFLINPNAGGMNHFLIKAFLPLSPPFTKGDLGGF